VVAKFLEGIDRVAVAYR